MASMLFYNNITPLNANEHGKWKLQDNGGDYSYAKHTHYVPLAGSEFYAAAGSFPIVFGGTEDAPMPIALLGVETDQNLFVDNNGQWQADSYVPAFVRRYPFILARGEEQSEENLTVCMDADYAGFNTKKGEALFDADGNQTEMLQRIVTFLQEYYAETERTQSFVQKLTELGMLVRRDMQLSDPQGRTLVLRDFRVIDEKKLDELEQATVWDLHRQGFLGWIHAHLVSMNQFNKMTHIMAQAA